MCRVVCRRFPAGQLFAICSLISYPYVGSATACLSSFDSTSGTLQSIK